MQGGNNNTYCHDSELNWFNWEQAHQDETGYTRFFRCLVNLRSALVPNHLPVLQFAEQPTVAYTSFDLLNMSVQTHGATQHVQPLHMICCHSCGAAVAGPAVSTSLPEANLTCTLHSNCLHRCR